MSRKHYTRAAAIIAASNGPNRERAKLAEAFAEMFGEDNDAFDHERFIDACEVKYAVRRRFEDGRPSKHIRGNLTLSEARTHCRRDDTSGVLRSGVRWFDGYDVQ